MNKSNFSEKLQKFALLMQSNRYLQAISNGLMSALPILMIGSFAVLLAVLPIAPWQTFIKTTGIQAILLIPYNIAIGCLALYVSFLVSYKLVESFEKEPVVPALVSVFCFLLVTPISTFEKQNAFLLSWFGVQGLFTALIVSLVAARLYIYVLDKNWTIKMPAGVPPTISNVFSGLIPAVIVGLFFLVIAGVFSHTHFKSFTQFIYTLVQTPLSSLGSNFISLFIIVLIQMILWFFGMHGSLVVSSIITAVYLPMDLQNLQAFSAGQPLPHILGQQFYNLYAGIGGAGGTLGLVILMLFIAKSKRLKTLGKLAIIPGCFTINEPVVFGVPMMFNPIMAIPFISVPLIQILVAYIVTYIGLVPPPAGVQVPFGVPVIVAGIMQGSWRIGLLQLVLIVLSLVIYYPFFKKLDDQSLQEELNAEKTNQQVQA
ncbi:PTS transporter subunit EIIC [Thermoanaerobacterium sp. CMT5567-10]|uniref:PTS sugar transporter subunit IIC n=1 Tax=Thermoanaerobacterium sp. CMT5567-10 TaxID=3061989 RepID=UPI0026DF7C0E|nr:PTS transporter subunit EIIC [Thermoanaerobacterium sp. CMT5567-10]WKV10118.1 PTS transporter subunit EIIC [Thermoanaerobacterium sp. CMT5567-10]